MLSEKRYYWLVSVFLFVPVNSGYPSPDIAVRGVSIKAVLLVVSGISDRPVNIAGAAFLTLLNERFQPACSFSIKHRGFH